MDHLSDWDQKVANPSNSSNTLTTWVSVCHVLKKLKNCKEATSHLSILAIVSIWWHNLPLWITLIPFFQSPRTSLIEKSHHSFPLLSQHDLKHKISQEILFHHLTFSRALFRTLKFKKWRAYKCVLHFGMYNLKFSMAHEKPIR